MHRNIDDQKKIAMQKSIGGERQGEGRARAAVLRFWRRGGKASVSGQ